MDSVDSTKPPVARKFRNSIGSAARRRRLEIRRFRLIANTNNNTSFLEPLSKKQRSSSSSSSPGSSPTNDASAIDLSAKVMEDRKFANGWHCNEGKDDLCSSDRSSSLASTESTDAVLDLQLQDDVLAAGEKQHDDEQKVDCDDQVVGNKLVSSAVVSSRCSAMDGCPPHGSVFICGRRREMEDAVAVVPFFMSVPCGTVGGCDCNVSSTLQTSAKEDPGMSALHFFGVYDGHGGSQVADFCKENLHRAVVDEFSTLLPTPQPGELNEQMKRALVASFLKIDAQVGGHLGRDEESNNSSSASPSFIAPETVGSTAVVAVVGSNRILVANCGDSRAVLSRGGRAIPLSRDHKPYEDDELARVEAAGGRVIFWNGYRVLGVLAMSRAIGDRYLKPFIIPEPDVTCTERSEDDECLILASDGLWDVLPNEMVCEIARRCLSGRHRIQATADDREESSVELAAGLLTKIAIAKGSCDNISVVVVDLRSEKKRRRGGDGQI